MALTATELITLRHMTGGIVATNEADYLTDQQLQAEYDAATNWDNAIIRILRRRWAMTSVMISMAAGMGSGANSLQQHFEHLERLLQYWEARTGDAGPALTAGAFDLGLDTE